MPSRSSPTTARARPTWWRARGACRRLSPTASPCGSRRSRCSGVSTATRDAGRRDSVRAHRLALIGRIQARNVVGAVLAFLYFRVIDPLRGDRPVGWADVAFFVFGVALLGAVGIMLGTRAARPLVHPDRAEPQDIRRAALMFPYTMAALSIIGWTLAGGIWGVFWPWMTGVLSMRSALRGVFGITVLGGGVTAAYIFLSTERRW